MCLSIGGTYDNATCICDLTDDSKTDSTSEEASEDKSTDPFNLVGSVSPEVADLLMGCTSIAMFLL